MVRHGVSRRQQPHPRAPKQPPRGSCLAPSSWVYLLFSIILLALLALSSSSPLSRGVRTLRAPSLPSLPDLALPSLPTQPWRGAGLRVRDYCAWSQLAWDDPASFIRWSSSTNFTALNHTHPVVDGVFQLAIEGCDLSWVTQRTARQCLASLGHFVVVGDSVSRLLFMSLTHFLHTGAWAPLDSEHPPSDAPRAWIPPAPEGQDSAPLDIQHYLAATSARLHGAELCDCYIGQYHTENRYYREAGVAASYVSFFSHAHGLRLHSPAFLNATCPVPPCTQAGCAVGACSDEASPNPQDFLHLPEGPDLAALVPLLRPDLLLFNAGHHRSLDTEEGRAEVLGIARGMAQGEAARAAARRAAAAQQQQQQQQQQQPRDFGLREAWNAYQASRGSSPGAAEEVGSSSSIGSSSNATQSARSFVWRTTTPRKDPDGVWTEVLSPARTAYPGAPVLGPSLAAPRGPWPTYEASISAAVAALGGRTFDAFTLLWPLVMLARAEGRPPTIAAVFAHPLDTLHHAPGVNSQLNRALLSFLCEDYEGELEGGG